MISIKCPHCKVGLKIDESRIPQGIESFKCPKCKNNIPLSWLEQHSSADTNEDTIVTNAKPAGSGIGRLTVPASEYTPFQVYQLKEGACVIGRKAKASTADLCIRLKLAQDLRDAQLVNLLVAAGARAQLRHQHKSRQQQSALARTAPPPPSLRTEDGTCMICKGRNNMVRFVPCCHAVVCKKCIDNFAEKTNHCPVCLMNFFATKAAGR